MPCPYCPYLEKVIEFDAFLTKTPLYTKLITKEIPKFILRNREQIKLYIEAYETKDPSLIL